MASPDQFDTLVSLECGDMLCERYRLGKIYKVETNPCLIPMR